MIKKVVYKLAQALTATSFYIFLTRKFLTYFYNFYLRIKNHWYTALLILLGLLFYAYIIYLRIFRTRTPGPTVPDYISNFRLILTIVITTGFLILLISATYSVVKAYKENQSHSRLVSWILKKVYKFVTFFNEMLETTYMALADNIYIIRYFLGLGTNLFIDTIGEPTYRKILLSLIYGIPLFVSMIFFVDSILKEYRYFPVGVYLLIIPLILRVVIFMFTASSKRQYDQLKDRFDVKFDGHRIVEFSLKEDQSLFSLPDMPDDSELTFEEHLESNFDIFNLVYKVWYLCHISWFNYVHKEYKKTISLVQASTFAFFFLGWCYILVRMLFIYYK